MINYPRNRRGASLPLVPKPAAKEIPVTEKLTRPVPHHDPRPKVIKPFDNVMVPHLNKMYGSLRTEDGWTHLVDNYAKGGLTTVQGTLVQSAVTLALSNPETRLSRWPGGTSMYLAIRMFSLAPTTATFATAGSLDLYYQDIIGGQVVPLGSIINNQINSVEDMAVLIPTPITDPGALANQIGNIQATLSAAGTVGTYIWQIGFSYAYLLPTVKPYEIQHVEEMYDAHPGHVGAAR